MSVWMRTFTKATLRKFWAKNASSKEPLNIWFRGTEDASWACFAAVKTTFNSVDQVGNKVVFNVGGNNYSLIAQINCEFAGVLIKWIGTHAEYNALTKKDIQNL
jgi:mRNA interferase HigB